MSKKKPIYDFPAKYGNYKVYLEFGVYKNGRTAIELKDAEDGMPVMVVTVNMDNAPLFGDEIIIKNYSENEGVLQFLQANGIVGPAKRWIASGWVTCPVVDLLIKPY